MPTFRFTLTVDVEAPTFEAARGWIKDKVNEDAGEETYRNQEEVAYGHEQRPIRLVSILIDNG